jgi:adenylyltransferase/sulfurtransferase
VLCKGGVRSAKILLLLQEAGISGINVTGGIDAWSQQIDPLFPYITLWIALTLSQS